MMVIKKTLKAYGAQYVLEDLGASGAVAATAPTISLALDAADPSHVVDVTVTNIRRSSRPTRTAASRSSTPHSCHRTAGVRRPGSVASSGPTSSSRVPRRRPVRCRRSPIGSVVAVRAQSRPGAGQLASAWSAWSTITLNAPTAVNTLAWTNAGNGAGTLSWVLADTATPIQVWMTDGYGHQLVPITQLAPGSTSLQLVGLTASTRYTASVAHLEPASSSGFTQPAQVTFTTGSSTGTCATPDNPIAYSLVHPTPQAIGFCVYKSARPRHRDQRRLPGRDERWVGRVHRSRRIHPGGRAAVRLVRAQGVVPERRAPAPAQGQGRARGRDRLGVLAAGVRLPGTYQGPSDYPVTVPACTLAIVNSGSGQAGQLAIAVSYTPPTDVQFLQMVYGVQVRPAGSTGAYTTLTSVAGTTSGLDFIPVIPGNQYLITPSTVTTGSPALLTQDGIAVAPTPSTGAGIPITVPLTSRTPRSARRRPARRRSRTRSPTTPTRRTSRCIARSMPQARARRGRASSSSRTTRARSTRPRRSSRCRRAPT